MSIKRGNNHGAKPGPNEDEHARKQALLRLGDILAEIADDLEEKEANISEDQQGDKEALHEKSENAARDNQGKEPPT